jgi:hypothetical protein
MSWVLTAYIRVLLVDVVFVIYWSILNLIVDFDWNSQYIISFGALVGGFFIFSITCINSALFISCLFSDIKFAGEVATFFHVVMLFFVYALFVPTCAE